MPQDALYTTGVVADMIKCSKRTIHKNAKAKNIGMRVGSQLIFTQGDIEKLAKVIRPKAGRPPKDV